MTAQQQVCTKAAVIDLSDDEELQVEIPHLLRSKHLREDSDEQLAARLQRREEIKLAARLRKDEEMLSLIVPDELVVSDPTSTTHDAVLALRLQHDEEELASARHIEVMNAHLKKPRTSHQHGSCNEGARPPSIRAELAPACVDAVALIRDCFRFAKDVGRSQIFLCESTPFFIQHRLRGRRESSVAMATNDGNNVSAQKSDYWTCGYRNVQMLVGHLQLRNGSVDSHFSSLFNGTVPDVSSLQLELERLWALGYDQEGCQQLGGSVCGTQKWIGTSEACVLLRGQSVRCNIVGFRGGMEDNREGSICAAEAVVERVFKHFRKGIVLNANLFGCGVVTSSQPPLYLQHDGHSRTVVGIQRRQEPRGKHTDLLLVLDPGLGEHGVEDLKSSASRGYGWERFVKRSLAPLKKKGEYELLIVEVDSPIGVQDVANSRCIRQFV